MKYFLGEIFERNGEYEYYHTRIYQCKTLEDANKALDDEAKFWYGSISISETHISFNGGGEWWQNGEILTSVSKPCVQIPKTHYDILHYYGV